MEFFLKKALLSIVFIGLFIQGWSAAYMIMVFPVILFFKDLAKTNP